jgi:putative transposase
MIPGSKLSVNKTCSTLQVSKSGFYDWQNRIPKDDDNKKLRKEIHRIALEFPFYGYRRVTAELRNRNKIANHKKVLKVMREEELICRRKKRFKPVTTQSDHNLKVYPNLARDLNVTGLNQLWLADITYIHLGAGFVYLAAIIDLFSRKCIGWSLSRTIDTQLTLDALNMAIAARRQFDLSKLVHHSDRGVQYAAEDYIERLLEIGAQISMSRKGNPYDNAWMESFMKTLKAEEVYINEYETILDVYKNIKQFIEKVYNKKRLHSSLDYTSPDKFEQEVLNNIVD